MAHKNQSTSSKLHARQKKTINARLARQQHIHRLRQKQHFLNRHAVSMHYTLDALEALHHSQGNTNCTPNPQMVYPIHEDTLALIDEMQDDIRDQFKSIDASKKKKKTVMRRRKVDATWKHIHQSVERLHRQQFEFGLRIDPDVRQELDQQVQRMKANVYRQMSAKHDSRASLAQYITLLHAEEARVLGDIQNALSVSSQQEVGAED